MIGIICHDAGAAYVIAAYALANPNDYVFYLEGPAVEIFGQVYGSTTSQSFEEVFKKADALYIGTSVNTETEFTAISRAKESNIPSTVFLDHWVKFKERFERSGKVIFPDEIVVSDAIAKELILDLAPQVKITEIENPYISYLQNRAKSLYHEYEQGSVGRALWLSDPFDEIENPFNQKSVDANPISFLEIDAYVLFAKRIRQRYPGISELLIRPHPTEKFEKFGDAYQVPGFKVSVSVESELLLDIMRSEVIGGVSTMALYIAHSLGAKCFTSIPDDRFIPLQAFSEIKKI